MDREDALCDAFDQHRTNKGGILLEKEIEAMLKAMVKSGSHLYVTSDKQVTEFLWVEMNSLGGNDSESEEGEEDEDGDSEVQAVAQLTKLYNRMIDNCLTIARLKKNRKERVGGGGVSTEVVGVPQRRARASHAFQGKISESGEVGDSGRELPNAYAAEEKASAAFFENPEGVKKKSPAITALLGPQFDQVGYHEGHLRFAAGPPVSAIPKSAPNTPPGYRHETGATWATAGERAAPTGPRPAAPEMAIEAASPVKAAHASAAQTVALQGLPQGSEAGDDEQPVANAKGKAGGYRRRRFTNLDKPQGGAGPGDDGADAEGEGGTGDDSGSEQFEHAAAEAPAAAAAAAGDSQ